MKQLSCRELGGACDHMVQGASFEEIGKNCRVHVMAMMEQGDEAHKQAAMAMCSATPEQQAPAMAEYRKRYDAATNV